MLQSQPLSMSSAIIWNMMHNVISHRMRMRIRIRIRIRMSGHGGRHLGFRSVPKGKAPPPRAPEESALRVLGWTSKLKP